MMNLFILLLQYRNLMVDFCILLYKKEKIWSKSTFYVEKTNSKENEECCVYLHMNTANWRKLRILVYFYYKNAISIWKRQILNKICQNLKKMTDFTYIYKKKIWRCSIFAYFSMKMTFWRNLMKIIYFRIFLWESQIRKKIIHFGVWKFKFWQKTCILHISIRIRQIMRKVKHFIIFL